MEIKWFQGSVAVLLACLPEALTRAWPAHRFLGQGRMLHCSTAGTLTGRSCLRRCCGPDPTLTCCFQVSATPGDAAWPASSAQARITWGLSRRA